MKRTVFFALLLLLIIGSNANAQDFFLLPQNFYLHKADKLNLHLLSGNEFAGDNEYKYAAAKVNKFMLYDGSKKIDLTKVVNPADTASNLFNYALDNSGLAMFALTREDEQESERNKFLKSLENEGLDQMLETAKNSNQQYFVEKYHRHSKTLIMVDKPNGKDWDKPLGDDYEIILQQNPYKASYGDDVTAVVLFKGKPLKDAVVMLYVKTINGNVFPTKLTTNADGLVYFKLSREGIYMVSSVHMEAAQDKNADFESWSSTYTFAFSNTGDMPNSYKDFGFGNKH